MKYISVLASELSRLPTETFVRVTGVVSDKKKLKGKTVVFVTDITGTLITSVSKDRITDSSLLNHGNKIRICGKTIKNKKGDTVVSDVERIEVLSGIITEEDIDIIDQEARLLTSKISGLIREILVNEDFQEITTRVISRSWEEALLEPMMVKFPGFGAEAYLSPSPSSQLSEFLAVTLLPKVFTQTISFTQSYRFKNASTEMPFFMAKAFNMDQESEENLIRDITKSIFKKLSDQNVEICSFSSDWSESISSVPANPGTYTYGVYKTSIPIVGQKWNSVVETIIRLTDSDGNLLAEGTREVVSEKTTISTFSFYPTQYLSIVKKAPRRILQNLWKFDGGRLYD